MKIRWLLQACIVVAVGMGLASCTKAEIEQAMNRPTEIMLQSSPCQPAGIASTATPEFCVNVTDIQLLRHDTQAEVSLTLVNRTGRRLFIYVSGPPSLTDSGGTRWNGGSNTGLGSGTHNPVPVEPNIETQGSLTFFQSGRAAIDLTFSLRGEIVIAMVDSRGQPIPYKSVATRGFNISGIRIPQPSPQSSVPTEQNSDSKLAQVSPQGVAPAKPETSVSAQSSVPVAVAGAPAAPVNVDIVGLRLGMTPEEVRQAIQEHDKNFKFKEQRASLEGLPGVTFLSQVIGALDRRLPVGSQDSIGVHFPPPPHRSQAIFIDRFTTFEEGKQPLALAIKDALIKKYGAPSFSEEPGFEIYLEWAYDPSGVRITDSFREKKCMRFNVAEPRDMPNIYFEKRTSASCGVTILAWMARNWVRDGGQPYPGQLATVLGMYIIDGSVLPAMRAATQSYVDSTMRDSAQKRGIPKF